MKDIKLYVQHLVGARDVAVGSFGNDCTRLLRDALSNIILPRFRRNDYISSVREASQVALEKIGGEEANKAMHMTKVLAEEIRMLTSE